MNFNSINEKILFYNIPTYLFCLLPLFLISGPLLSDLSVSIITLLFFNLYNQKKKKFFISIISFFIFLYVWFYLIFNTLINNFNLDSLKISFFYFRYGVFVLAIVQLLYVDDRFIKYFFLLYFFLFCNFNIRWFLSIFFFQENILGFKSGSAHRVSSFFMMNLF